MNMDIVEALRQMNRGDFREEPRIYVSAEDAADEIERLRALCDELAEALRVQCNLHRVPVATTAWYSQHAKDALAKYEARR